MYEHCGPYYTGTLSANVAAYLGFKQGRPLGDLLKPSTSLHTIPKSIQVGSYYIIVTAYNECQVTTTNLLKIFMSLIV